MRLLFTICARKGSKGLKNKNISDFLGKPLCYYTLAAYKQFCSENQENICTLALNTDSIELKKQFEDFGIPFIYIERTPELAGDTVGKIDVIKDTYNKINEKFDYIVDLDLTSPLRTANDIKGVLNTLICTANADLAFSVTQPRRSPFFNQVKKDSNGFYKPVINVGALTRQEVPKIFDMNASIYAYKPEFLSAAKKIFDGNAAIYEMKDTAVLDIDNPEDKELMEIIAGYFFKKYPEYNFSKNL